MQPFFSVTVTPRHTHVHPPPPSPSSPQQNPKSKQTRPHPLPSLPPLYRLRYRLRRLSRTLRHIPHLRLFPVPFPTFFLFLLLFLLLLLFLTTIPSATSVKRPPPSAHSSYHSRNDTTYFISTARVNITPDFPVWLSGFSSRTHPPPTPRLLDPKIPLYARALAIHTTTSTTKTAPPPNLPPNTNTTPTVTPVQTLVLLSLDLIALPRNLSNTLYRLAARRFNLSRATLRICVTHTHSGPVVADALAPLSPTDDVNQRAIARYERMLIDAIVDLLTRLLAGGVPRTAVRVAYRVGRALLAVNRGQVSESVFKVRGEGDDRGGRGMTWDEVPVLVFRRVGDGGVVAGVFGYAAHATVLTGGYEYSGDYPAVAAHELEGRYEGSVWLFVAGCGGDQNIYPRGTRELLRRHGAAVADAVWKAVEGDGDDDDDGRNGSGYLLAGHMTVRLPFARRYTRLQLRARGAQGEAQRRAVAVLLGRMGVDGRTARGYDFPIGVWGLGGVVMMAFLGGEPTVGYAGLLRGVGVDWTVGYSEEVMGYVGTGEVIAGGGREGGERAAWYYGLPAAWSGTVEMILVEGVRTLVEEVRRVGALERDGV